MKSPSRRGQAILGAAAVVILTALSLVAVAVVGGVVNPGVCNLPGHYAAGLYAELTVA